MSGVELTGQRRPRFPPFEPVISEPTPGQWSRELLIGHVQTAMKIELATLPIYFCALYSIKRDNGGYGSKARAHILSVAEQEMLHLALVGNMLTAMDGKQPLYHPGFMPTYPSEILYEEIPMKLQPANKENLEYFVRIEAPYMPPPIPPPTPKSLMNVGTETSGSVIFESIARDYKSIGQFYAGLKNGIEEVWEQDKELFSYNEDKQLRGAEFFDSQMTVIVDKATAFEALATIVEQGEGGIAIPESHYAIFVELYQQRKNWECVNYVHEPRTAKYDLEYKNEVAYRLSCAVDASYCCLLQTIDRCWEGDVPSHSVQRQQLLRNIHRLMVEVLSPAAHVLVQQRVGKNGEFAAPCFEFYPPAYAGKANERVPMLPHELFEALKMELELAKQAAVRAGDKDTADAVEKILFCVDGFHWGEDAE